MAKSTNPFRYFDSSPEVIRTVVMMYVKYPFLRNVEDLLAERGINGEMHYLWRAVDHEGEELMKRHGRAKAITTDGLRPYQAAMKELGNAEKQEVGRWAKPGWELTSALPTTRTGDAEVPADEAAAEVQLSSRRLSQPLQPGPPPHQQRALQGPTLSRPG